MNSLLSLTSFCIVSFWLLSLDEVNTAPSKPGARIIGGDDARAGQFPFAAAIYVQTDSSRSFCGGALLSREWVITSGNCVNKASIFTIQIGSHTLTNSDPERETFTSSEYVLHPDFNPDTIENDIALIKLRMPVTFTAYIQPVNLPAVSLLNQSTVTALGWGQTSDSDPGLSNYLQFVNVSVLSNAECKIYYGDQISDNMGCMEGNYNEGTCIGDNGGALVEYLHKFYWIVGIASFISSNGCESTEPSGFTRTYPYTDWIYSVINS